VVPARQLSRLLVQSGNSAILYLKPFKDTTKAFAVEGIAAPIHGRAELESVISVQAHQPNSGLIVMLDGFNINHRREITSGCSLPLPWCLSATFYPEVGGLLFYGNDPLDNFRRAAIYADRILRGTKPSELPVQGRSNSSWCSISRPPRRSARSSRHRCSFDEVIE
jgi:hypothetical protein